MRYAHTNIITKDWKRLSQFYIDVFECQLVPPHRRQSGDWLSEGTGVPKAQLEGVHLRLPGHGTNGPTLEIYTYLETVENLETVSNRTGYGHIAFEVEDVEVILSKALDHGGSTYGKIISKKIKGVGTITFTYLKDPDGNIIEIQHWE